MADQIHFDPIFKVLICKVHGRGVHPCREAIKRHLRMDDHGCKRAALRQAASLLASLPLNSLQAVRNATPNVSLQPMSPPRPYLRVVRGWSCLQCAGHFLTTSLELVQRHAAVQHGRRRGEDELWEACKLQTFFSETKDRHYFRVATASAAAATATAPTATRTSSVNDEQPWEVQTGTIGHPAVISSSSLTLTQSITFRHPFTLVAEKHVHLSPSRLDLLCKSHAFRSASEPLFDGNHVDAALNMHSIFPQSEEEPVFINALLYSTVQIMNRGTTTVEGLLIQTRTIRLLNDKLADPLQSLSFATVGAIMILKTTAYKTRDLIAYNAHTQGLTSALKILTEREDNLKTTAKHLTRAMFWVDLYSAVLIDSNHRLSHPELHSKVNWRRERRPELVCRLPSAFVRHQYILPVGILECILDILELQSYLCSEAVIQAPLDAKYLQLDPMQASIESRLALHAQACRESGVVAEAVRLAVFMCCYCSWIETWNDCLIPCKLVEKLLDLLEPTILSRPWDHGNVWLQNIDILFWLLLVTSSVVELDRGYVEGLRLRQSHLLMSVSSAWKFGGSCYSINPKEKLEEALQDFIYVDGWLSRRCNIKEWFILELSIGASSSSTHVRDFHDSTIVI